MVCRGLHWFVLKIPRGDANGVGEDELTVTSGLHAQAERTKKQRNKTENRTEVTVTSKLHAQVERAKKQKREEKAASSGGAGRDPGPEDGA